MQPVSKAELNAAWKYSASFENIKRSLYLDSKGVPTIGAGYTSHIWNERFKRWELRTSVAADMKAAGVTLTKAQLNALKQMETDMNTGGAKNNPRVVQGVASLQSVQVDKGQARKLFEQIYDRNRGLARNSIGQQTFDSLPDERKAVLGSIAYQSPAAIAKAGPELAKHFAAGDYAAAGKTINKLGQGAGADAARFETMGTLMENPNMTNRGFVRPGDTLSGIAKNNGTTVQEILRLNNITDPNKIRAGTILNLPPKKPSGQAGPGAQPPAAGPNQTPAPKPGVFNDSDTGLRSLIGGAGGDGISGTGGEAPFREIQSPPTLERILESPVSEWSEDDVGRVHAEAARLGAVRPRGKALSTKVSAWYDHFYGNDPAPADATGRTREPRPFRPIPTGVGAGPVHVRAHTRSQDGTTVNVDAHSRSRPRP